MAFVRDLLALRHESAYVSKIMRQLPSIYVPILGTALVLTAQVAASAPGAAEPDAVVVRCGESTIGSSRIARSFGRLRDFQRKAFGDTQQLQLRGFVEQITVRDALIAERGRKSGLLDSPRIRSQHRLLLEEALIARLRSRLDREAPITDADVKAYFDAHPELFRTPERIRIFRILVEDEADAVALIAQIKQLPSMDDWRNLVREKTKDKATSERGGDLGFVAEDGSTDVPELEVDRALYAASHAVKDGEVVPKPVPEGKRFAVIWRRGSLAARTRELANESAQIRQQLSVERIDRELAAQIAQLRQTYLRDHHPEKLNGREFPAPGFAEGSAATAPSALATTIPATQ